MPEINLEQDLTTVTEQIGKLAEELNKLNAARDNLIQQIQNLSGVAMYLRGKIEPSTQDVPPTSGDDFERSSEYPEDKPSAKK